MRTPYKNTKRTRRDPPRLHFYYPKYVDANCSKITREKLRESKRE